MDFSTFHALPFQNLNFNSHKVVFEDFLSKILEKNPQRRLGCFNDEIEILEHDIFKELLWKKGNGLVSECFVQYKCC